jgi:hypothetical protein
MGKPTTEKAKLMARRLTGARQAAGLQVDQIYHWLVKQRMAAKSPKPGRLWIGTVRKWFRCGIDEIPEKFHTDFERLCRLLSIGSIDELWTDRH